MVDHLRLLKLVREMQRRISAKTVGVEHLRSRVSLENNLQHGHAAALCSPVQGSVAKWARWDVGDAGVTLMVENKRCYAKH